MSAVIILEVLESIASAMYERTREPYWKKRVEWIKEQKEREVQLAVSRLRI